jgi:hypothetical protein
VTEWQTALLAVIAGSVLVMAVLQVTVVTIAGRYARDAARAVDELRREVRPLIEKANRISDDAARVTAMAATQVERVDRLLASTANRIDETVGVVQGALLEPVRQGAAMISAVRAAFGALRGARDRHRAHADEDEALFVG